MMMDRNELIRHLDSVRKRTLKYLEAVPESMMDWRPGEGKFSVGDIIRHLGSAELMFYRAITESEWGYSGHGPEKGATLADAVRYLNQCHETVMEGLRQLDESHLTRKVRNVLGYEVSAWRLIMAMAEHEIHHRGQLSAYMQANQFEPPQIYGIKIEEVSQQSGEG